MRGGREEECAIVLRRRQTATEQPRRQRNSNDDNGWRVTDEGREGGGVCDRFNTTVAASAETADVHTTESNWEDCPVTDTLGDLQLDFDVKQTLINLEI